MDRLVTVFGGGGFLGRYVVQALLDAGARVRVASRNPKNAWFLKPLGGLGQTQFVLADATRFDSVTTAVRGSDAVVNLVGILKGDFTRFHVESARNLARAARAADAGAFVHVSAIGADPASKSAYGRSKGEGEAAVREAFPNATIIRPSILFGPEDGFVNRFAGMIASLPVVPVIRPTALFQPAFAGDVAQAIMRAVLDPLTHGGVTYELGGPEAISMRALNAFIADAIGRTPLLIDVPDKGAELMARFGGKLPGAPMTWDQWLMMQTDNVVAADAPGFAAFGIDPAPLAAVAPRWLVRYRRQGRFSVARVA